MVNERRKDSGYGDQVELGFGDRGDVRDEGGLVRLVWQRRLTRW